MVRRARRINRELAEVYPYAHPELDFRNPFELLVATVLSAQTTDLRVNQTTPALFAEVPTPEDLAAANPEEVEEIIRPTGFFRAKTKSVIGPVAGPAGRLRRRGPRPPRGPRQAARRGPQDRVRRARQRLRASRHHRGHPLRRLVRRWKWTEQEDPEKIEAEIGAIFPKSEWTMLSHRVIFHGRRICHARKPACGACPIAPLCPAYGEGETDPEKAKKLLKYEKGGYPGPAPATRPQAYLARAASPAPPLGRRMPRRRTASRDAHAVHARRGDRSQAPHAGVGRAARRAAGADDARQGRATDATGASLRTATWPSAPTGLPAWLDPVVRAARDGRAAAAQPLPAARERRAGGSPPS